MEWSPKSPASRASQKMESRRSRPAVTKRAVDSALEVTDVVQHGTGRGSRIDLTVSFAGRQVRLSGLRAEDALSYSRVEKSAMGQGLTLPYFRHANEVWRKLLLPAMEQARFEPSLEGEEISEAVAEEIRARLERSERGDGASDLVSGKVVEHRGRLLVSPQELVKAVRGRLVDDVLTRATIAEAAKAHLGMRESRPCLVGGRPNAWTFPVALAATVEPRPGQESARSDAGRTGAIRSTYREPVGVSPVETTITALDPAYRPKMHHGSESSRGVEETSPGEDETFGDGNDGEGRVAVFVGAARTALDGTRGESE